MRLAPRGSSSLENRKLLTMLLDMAEATPPSNQPTSTGDQLQSQAAPVTMLGNSGL